MAVDLSGALTASDCRLRIETNLEIYWDQVFLAAAYAPKDPAAGLHTQTLRASSATLRRLAYHNVLTRFGDGAEGWPDAGPFDAIVVTAAPVHAVPSALTHQLAEGGRLIAPVGGKEQYLQIIMRHGRKLSRKRGAGVRFVPLTGSAAQ